MIGRAKFSPRIGSMLFLLALLGWAAVHPERGFTETVIHVEDFVGVDYADTLQTTADWNTGDGVLKLHGQGLAEIGALGVGGLAYAAAWKNDRVLVANHTGNGLAVVNVSDPANPTLVTAHPMPGNARNVTVSGNWAFVSLGNSLAVQLVNVANPDTPVNGANVNLGSYTGEVVVNNNWVYTASYNSGVGAIEITDPANPILMPLVDMTAWVRGLSVQGSFLYLASDAAMTVMSLANPAAPDSVAVVPVSGSTLCVSTSGTWAYVGGNAGLDIVDISQPTNPQFVTNLSLDGGAAYHIAVQGDSLFVANGANGLKIIDVSHPNQPQVLSNFFSSEYFYHTLLQGNEAYASNGNAGLLTLQADAQGLDADRNRAVSANLNPTGEPVLRARLSAAYTDSIRFEMTANGGSTWQDIPPDDSWLEFDPQGTDLRWRATLVQAGPFPGPICDNLTVTFDRAHSYAEISSASDVPGDTGGQVRLAWNASRFDASGQSSLVTEYSVYRRYDLAKMAAYPPGNWEFLLTVPADQEATYAVSVPTLADSSSAGTHWSVYFVRARTSTPGTFYDSPPDSGYSLNNLAPPPPSNFVVQRETGGVQLTWDPSAEPDFAHFRIYRVATPFTQPSPATLHQVLTTNSHYDATNQLWYYQLTAVNQAGIESAPAPHPTAVGEVPAGRAVLRQNSPNPFNPITRIAYSVPPGGGQVRLEIYDFRGSLVATLVQGFAQAGDHFVDWRGLDDAGRSVASGLYTCRLSCENKTSTMKMTLIR